MMARDYERVREDAEEWIKRFDNRPHKYGYDFGLFSKYLESGQFEKAKSQYREMVPTHTYEGDYQSA